LEGRPPLSPAGAGPRKPLSRVRLGVAGVRPRSPGLLGARPTSVTLWLGCSRALWCSRRTPLLPRRAPGRPGMAPLAGRPTGLTRGSVGRAPARSRCRSALGPGSARSSRVPWSSDETLGDPGLRCATHRQAADSATRPAHGGFRAPRIAVVAQQRCRKPRYGRNQHDQPSHTAA
jgi:hypothetical protein